MNEQTNNEKKFYELWHRDLPSKFPKKEAVKKLSNHWGINVRSTYYRISDERGLSTSDVTFLYMNFGIGFTMRTGFFFDNRKFEEIQASEEREEAAALGLIL